MPLYLRTSLIKSVGKYICVYTCVDRFTELSAQNRPWQSCHLGTELAASSNPTGRSVWPPWTWWLFKDPEDRMFVSSKVRRSLPGPMAWNVMVERKVPGAKSLVSLYCVGGFCQFCGFLLFPCISHAELWKNTQTRSALPASNAGTPLTNGQRMDLMLSAHTTRNSSLKFPKSLIQMYLKL